MKYDTFGANCLKSTHFGSKTLFFKIPNNPKIKINSDKLRWSFTNGMTKFISKKSDLVPNFGTCMFQFSSGMCLKCNYTDSVYQMIKQRHRKYL